MRSNAYCGDLLWQSSPTLPAPEASMNRYVLYDERFYEEWTEDERVRVNGGAR